MVRSAGGRATRDGAHATARAARAHVAGRSARCVRVRAAAREQFRGARRRQRDRREQSCRSTRRCKRRCSVCKSSLSFPGTAGRHPRDHPHLRGERYGWRSPAEGAGAAARARRDDADDSAAGISRGDRRVLSGRDRCVDHHSGDRQPDGDDPARHAADGDSAGRRARDRNRHRARGGDHSRVARGTRIFGEDGPSEGGTWRGAILGEDVDRSHPAGDRGPGVLAHCGGGLSDRSRARGSGGDVGVIWILSGAARAVDRRRVVGDENLPARTRQRTRVHRDPVQAARQGVVAHCRGIGVASGSIDHARCRAGDARLFVCGVDGSVQHDIQRAVARRCGADERLRRHRDGNDALSGRPAAR